MTKTTLETDYATCKRFIDAVTDLVNGIEDDEAAYYAAIDLVDEWIDTTDIEYELVWLIRRYIEKCDHPAEGIADIWDDEALPEQ